MPIVTVTPVGSINVRVNQDGQKVVHGTSTFIGSTGDVLNQVNTAISLATSAYETATFAANTAQDAYDSANTKLSLSGGTITGNLTVTGNVTTSEIYVNVIDAGTFI